MIFTLGKFKLSQIQCYSFRLEIDQHVASRRVDDVTRDQLTLVVTDCIMWLRGHNTSEYLQNTADIYTTGTCINKWRTTFQ